MKRSNSSFYHSAVNFYPISMQLMPKCSHDIKLPHTLMPSTKKVALPSARSKIIKPPVSVSRRRVGNEFDHCNVTPNVFNNKLSPIRRITLQLDVNVGDLRLSFSCWRFIHELCLFHTTSFFFPTRPDQRQIVIGAKLLLHRGRWMLGMNKHNTEAQNGLLMSFMLHTQSASAASCLRNQQLVRSDQQSIYTGARSGSVGNTPGQRAKLPQRNISVPLISRGEAKNPPIISYNNYDNLIAFCFCSLLCVSYLCCLC